MSVTEELLRKLRSVDERKEAHDPARQLLCDFLRLGIDDLCNRDPVKRRHARWWIHEDSSTGIDTTTGYLSFEGTCAALDIDAEAIRKALETRRPNGNEREKKNGAEKGHSNGRGRKEKSTDVRAAHKWQSRRGLA